jgi:RNA polymerase sigma factor (sigma-70 family)
VSPRRAHDGGEAARFDHGDDAELGFDDFFAANYDQLLTRLGRRGAPPELAEQIANFAFLVMQRKWNKLKPDNLVGYLNTVAYNELSKKLKNYLARLARVERAAIEALSQAHTHGDDVEISDPLKKLLNDLPPRQRQAVVLHHLRGYTVAEIAKIMGVTDATVRGYTRDGRIALSEAIERMKDDKQANEDGKD